MLNFDLTAKRVLVTGASRGIGRAICVALSEAGADVALVARSEEGMRETLALMRPGGHAAYAFDLMDTDGIGGLMERVARDGAELYGMVYDAGVSPAVAALDSSPEFVRDLMTVNFFGFAEMARRFAGQNRRGGRIIGISSVRSLVGGVGDMAYCASKAAMESAARAMAQEFAPMGILVNCVAPGFVKTDMFAQFVEAAGERGVNELLKRQCAGIVAPEDIAVAVTFLLAANGATGATLVVDGGYMACGC